MAKTVKSSLYEDLKRQILTMELDPDTDLDEMSLSERYGCLAPRFAISFGSWRARVISISARTRRPRHSDEPYDAAQLLSGGPDGLCRDRPAGGAEFQAGATCRPEGNAGAVPQGQWRSGRARHGSAEQPLPRDLRRNVRQCLLQPSLDAFSSITPASAIRSSGLART